MPPAVLSPNQHYQDGRKNGWWAAPAPSPPCVCVWQEENPVEVKARAGAIAAAGRRRRNLETCASHCSRCCHTAMASTAACALSSPSALVETRQLAPAPHCVGLPPLTPPPQSRAQRAGAYCRRISRNVVAMSTGESMATTTTTASTIVAPEESVAPTTVNGEATGTGTTELPQIVKTIQQEWDKVEDKYAVSTLAFTGVVALWGTTGMILAIDKLPLVPGALEIVGIGYTGWFAYKNLVFKPNREALVAKIKSIYKDIIGTS